jgi:energy-coupling factor transporter ATP-binding protein EcfA2
MKDRKIEPEGALNIIYGENESGKSTLLLFIKFMLYGLTRRSATNSERERSVSWSGHRAAGSMTFSHGDKTYRIERSFNESGRGGSEKLSVLCLDDGSEIDTEKSPGEYFLGVPREVFESTACVGQMRSSEINGDKLAYGIENMLSAADESVDTTKILKSLDSVRVGYRHKNKTGGSLYEDEQKMNALRQRIERAHESSQNLAEIERKLKAAKDSYMIAKADFDSKDALLGELNKVSTIKRFDALRENEKLKGELEKRREQKDADMKKGDFLPDRSHTAELKLVARAFSDAEKSYKAKREEYEGESKNNCDSELLSLGEKLEAAGGKAAVLFEIERHKAKAKSARSRAVILLVVGAVAAVAGGVAALLAFFAGAAAIALLPIAAVFAILSFKSAGRSIKEIERIAAEYSSSPSELPEKLDRCAAELISYRQIMTSQARLEAEMLEAERSFAAKKQALLEILNKTAECADATIDAAAQEYKRIEAYISERERLLRDGEALGRMIDAEREALSHYDEAELRASISVDPSEITPKMIADAERERSFFGEKARKLSDKMSALDGERMMLRANAEDPLPLGDALAELEIKHKTDREFYDALTLAMESIEQASSVLRGSVTPVISQKAGEILDKLSDGRYSVMRTNSTLGFSLDKDGYGVKSDSLSAGTKDAAYLSLRLSLFMRIFGTELPPLVLDESLCQLDEKRAERMLRLLGGLGDEGIQTLLFSSHKREEQICDAVGIEYHAIKL